MIPFVAIAADLDHAGLVWQPEVGDEITRRDEPGDISILFDSQGLTPLQLRQVYLWLPSMEQLVEQFEVRQAVLSHAGLEVSESGLCYKAVIQLSHKLTGSSVIETTGETLRNAMGNALRSILLGRKELELH